MKGDPLYTARERFDPSRRTAWDEYVAWSGLTQLAEVVSLDEALCPRLPGDVLPEDWAHVVNEDFKIGYFTDVDYLVKRIGTAVPHNLLCVFLNPDCTPSPPDSRFRFEGCDLLEVRGSISALTNCGGFPLSFANSELTPCGLLPSLERAYAVQAALRAHYPNEVHAQCDVWAIFRAVEAAVHS